MITMPVLKGSTIRGESSTNHQYDRHHHHRHHRDYDCRRAPTSIRRMNLLRTRPTVCHRAFFLIALILQITILLWPHPIESFPAISLLVRPTHSPHQLGVSLAATEFGETKESGGAFHKNGKARNTNNDSNNNNNMNIPIPGERNPIPEMPSDMFQRMAHSQLELLANSLTVPGDPTESKVESMALYLPQENVLTGQLEFTPVVLYPDPNTERVFIASDAASGQAPTLPPTLTKLPGFAHATALLPGYPMMYSDQVNPGVGVVEEVMCDARDRNKPAALSVPLLSGAQTVGVLLVSPSVGSDPDRGKNVWTKLDREQVSRAAQSLSMALSMDNERRYLKEQNNAFREGLSDSLHQVKNPLQALRTYGKILQRQLVANNLDYSSSSVPHLLELTERLMVQSERVVDLMIPMDTLVENLEESTRLALQPAEHTAKDNPFGKSPIVRSEPFQLLPWENETLEFARENSTSTSSELDTSSEYKTSEYSTFARKGPESPTREPTVSRSASNGGKPTKPMSTTVVGDVDLEMTFVGDVLEPILSAFRAISSERGIHFEVVEVSMDELPGVMAAPKSLQEAMSNVLDNAFKYVALPKNDSPFLKNPSPHVRVRMLASTVNNNNKNEKRKKNFGEPAGVIILVEDNGPGIATDSDREHIFHRGFRSESTKFIEGSGIGLDISRTLMERMGGTLDLADNGEFPNSLDGTIMKFTLHRRPKL